MKIQNLAVIFIIIMLPISMILTVYIQNQVKTLSMQTSYDTKLDNATYDALKAFQLNTINSSTSDLTNSKMRDIEASVNTFFNSIASNFNMAGYNQDVLKEYVPALVYTMYDGYYIYSPFINTLHDGEYVAGESTYQNNEKISGLKPYIHYSCRYKSGNIDVVITYSLDNYITIEGTDKNGDGIYASGYLIDNIENVQKDPSGKVTSVEYRGVKIDYENILKEYIGSNQDNNNLYEYIKVNGVKYYKYKSDIDGKDGWFTLLNGKKYGGQPNFKYDGKDYSAVQYYADAYEFRKTIRNAGLETLTTDDAVDIDGANNPFTNNIPIFTDSRRAIEEPDSNFNVHRLEVIRYSIEKNLSVAIANYNNYVGQGKANFQMPKLDETEWDKILNNVSIISFLQGLNIGGKIYNGYTIITNTKNKEVVTEDSIYIASNVDGNYHSVKETDLNTKVNSNNAIGILNIDLERVSVVLDNGSTENFYPKLYYADYTSVVAQTNITDTDNIYDYLKDKPNLAKLYYTALGRERYGTYKTSTNASDLVESLTK